MSTKNLNQHLISEITNNNLDTLSSAVVRVNNYSGEGASLGTGFIVTLAQLGFTEPVEMSYLDGIYGISAKEKKISVGINRPLVLTNAHVIEGASRITIETHDNIHLEAITLLCESMFDLGLLYIEDISKVSNQLNIIAFGNSDEIQTGSEACAIGMPHGQDFTYTIGSISHINAEANGISMIPAFQTDTELNPGNSGGPLLSISANEEGQIFAEVIGVNTFIFTQDGFSNTGINFALRINEVLDVLFHLISKQKAYFGKDSGFSARALNSFDQNALGLKSKAGFQVIDISKNSPFHGTLKQRDVIIAIDNKPTRRIFDFTSYAFLKVDEPFTLTVVRKGEELTLETAWEKEHLKLSHLINPIQKVFFADIAEDAAGKVVLLGADMSSLLTQAKLSPATTFEEVESPEQRHEMVKVKSLDHFYELCSGHGKNFYQVIIRYPNHDKATPVSIGNDFVNEE